MKDDRGEEKITLRGGQVEIEANGDIKIKSGTRIILEAPVINLVDNAIHPVVLGDQLLQLLNQFTTMFNAHTHPGQTSGTGIPVTPAPPAPPFPPPTPMLLSMKVKSG